MSYKFSLTLYGNSMPEIMAQLAEGAGIVSIDDVRKVEYPPINRMEIPAHQTAPAAPAPQPTVPVNIHHPATVAVTIAPTGPVEHDSRGMPWDERIHAKSKSKNQDGSWRYRRNTPEETIKAIEATLPCTINLAPGTPPTLTGVQQPAPQPAAPVAPPVQVMSPPVVATLPAAPAPQPVAPVAAFPPPAPGPVAVPTTGDDDNSLLDIPPFLQRPPQAPAAPVHQVQAPAAPVHQVQAPAAPVHQVQAPAAQGHVTYAQLIDLLSEKIKTGKIAPQSLPEFWAKIGVTGVQELTNNQPKIDIAYMHVVALG